MFETGDVWGLGGVGDWVGVSDGGGDQSGILASLAFY